MDESPSVQEKAKSAPHIPSATAQGLKGEIVVNVRFLPSGLVSMINHKPAHLSAQDWFDRLCRVAANTYRPLSGGRGAFRIDGSDFQLIWDANS